MKKIAFTLILLMSSFFTFAAAPGGPDCGWGNMLFEGKSGTGYHLLGSTFNGSTGNDTFGMSSGSNGCATSAQLTYGGHSLLGFTNIMTEFTEDVARGEGDALNAVAAMFGIKKQERTHFSEVTHANFETIFPSEKVTAEQVLQNLVLVMKSDERLAKYIV